MHYYSGTGLNGGTMAKMANSEFVTIAKFTSLPLKGMFTLLVTLAAPTTAAKNAIV